MSQAEIADIVIEDDGTVKMLGGDDLDMTQLGLVLVKRVTHILFNHHTQTWTVYDADSYGIEYETLERGFKTRAEALAWEHAWAKERYMT